MITYDLTEAELQTTKPYREKWTKITRSPIKKPTEKRIEELRLIGKQALTDIYAFLKIANPQLEMSPNVMIVPSIYHLVTAYNIFTEKDFNKGVPLRTLEKAVSAEVKRIAPTTFDLVKNPPNQKSPTVFCRGSIECFVLVNWFLDNKPELVAKMDPIEVNFIKGVLTLVQHFPNWSLTEEAEILTLAPVKMTIEETNNNWDFHNINGPCVTFTDGFSVYAIRNIQVPKKLIEDTQNLSSEDIEGISNGEIRRIIQEKMGYKNYLIKVGATVVDQDMVPINKNDPKSKVILRALMREKNTNQWLIANDGSTNRVYYIPVDRNAKTCARAHESTIRHLNIKDGDIAMNA